MKKFLLILLTLTITFSMISCFNQGNKPDDNQQGSGNNNVDDTNKPDNNPDDNTGNTPGQDQSGSDTATVSGEKIINVYLIAGQSNAVGYGMDTGNKIANSDERFTEGFENVLYYASLERWNGEKLDQGFQPVKLGMGAETTRSGAEIGIAASIADKAEILIK